MIDGGHAHAWEEENEGVDLEGHRAQMGPKTTVQWTNDGHSPDLFTNGEADMWSNRGK